MLATCLLCTITPAEQLHGAALLCVAMWLGCGARNAALRLAAVRCCLIEHYVAQAAHKGLCLGSSMQCNLGHRFLPTHPHQPIPFTCTPAAAGVLHAVLVAWRNRRATLLRLFAPFVFLLLALLIQLALDANSKRWAASKQQGVVERGATALCLYTSDLAYGTSTVRLRNLVSHQQLAVNGCFVHGATILTPPPFPPYLITPQPHALSTPAGRSALGRLTLPQWCALAQSPPVMMTCT